MRRLFTYIAPLAILLFFVACCGRRTESSSLDRDLDLAKDSIAAGNNPWADSLLSSLREKVLDEGDSIAFIRVLLMQGLSAYYSSDFERTMTVADTAIEFTRTHPDATILQEVAKMAARIKGAYYQQYAFNADSAIRYQKIALEYTDRSDTPDYVLSLANLADAYKLDSRYAEATDTYMRGILYADSVGLPAPKAEPLYSGLAGTLTAMGDYDEAQKWWNRAGRLYPSMDRFARFAYLNNLGNHYYYARRYPESLRTFDRLRLYLDSIGASDWERSFCDANRADIFLRLDNVDSARVILDRISPFLLSTQSDAFVKTQIHTLRMRLLLAEGRLPELARMVAEHPYSDSLRNEQGLWRLELLEKYYTRAGDWRNAYEIHHRWDAIHDSLLSEHVRQNLDAKKLAYERDTTMLSLRADNSRSQARVFRLGMILGLSILAIVILAVVYLTARRRAANREERMLRKIMDLRLESGRSRVTPHFIYNALNQVLLDDCSNPDAPRQASPANDRLQAIIRLLRRQQTMTDRILIPLSEELAFLSDYVAVQAARSSAPLDYSVVINPGVETGDYLVPSMALQILAENAFKHGFPTLAAGQTRLLRLSIAISDSQDNPCLSLVMENNVGSEDIPSNGTGLGLRIISQTIEYLNHRFRTSIRFSAAPGGPGMWRAELRIPQNPPLEDFETPVSNRK